MFDSQSQDLSRRTFKVVSIGHLAREGRWSLEVSRSYLVPVLIWVTTGQGRLAMDGQVQGFNTHSAIYLPANTPHAFEVGMRTHGSAVFFGGRSDLPVPPGPLHLRLRSLQKQGELNQLVERLARDSGKTGPYADDVLFHEAALTLLWIAREAHDISQGYTPPAMPLRDPGAAPLNAHTQR